MDDEELEKRKTYSSISEGYADGEEPVVFYYSRERRLANAPRAVRDYYMGKSPRPATGLFKVLVQTRSSRMMLFVMIGMLLFTLFYGLVDFLGNEKNINGIPVSLEVFFFEDSVYASVKFAGSDPKGGPVPVSVQFRFFTDGNNLFETKSAEGLYDGAEYFLRTVTADYDIVQVEAVVTVGDETGSLTYDAV